MPRVEDNYFESGLNLLESGELETAVAMFDSAIKLGLGDLATVYVARAEALMRLEQWEAAEQSLNNALAIEPYMALAHLERGNLWRRLRQYDKAIHDYTMAIQGEPTYEEAYYQRALAYEEQRLYAEAEADLTRTLALNPEVLEAYEVRGRMRAAQYKFDEAIADLSYYLRSGGGKAFDNHSETQGYLLLLRLQRLVWALFSRRR